MSWKEDPASEKQLAFLKDFGFEPQEPLTKGQASDLIEQFLADPERLRIREERKATASAQRMEKYFDEIKNPAYPLHVRYEEAKTSLQSTNRGSIREAESELQEVKRERLAFWQRTFRDWDDDRVDTQSNRLYLAHGYRLKPPSNDTLQHILDALDANSATWDRDTPEYLFQTVEYNFPNLLRKHVDFEGLEFSRRLEDAPTNEEKWKILSEMKARYSPNSPPKPDAPSPDE